MSISTNLVSGLVSGFDWRTMIDQLIAIDRRRVDLLDDKKTDYESQLNEWQKVNTMLLSLKSAAEAISTETAFNLYTSSTTSNTTTSASSILTASTSSSASAGLYNVMVNNLAQCEKVSSKNYSATDTALSLEGDIVVSGKAVNIALTDTLADVKDKINAVNTGEDPSNVTASIVTHGVDNYHLVLTSDNTGEDGISIVEGAYSGGDNILEEMGFITSTTTIKNTTSDGAKSDLFTSSNGLVATLLNLTNAPGATSVTIGGNSVSINLSSQSITTIASNIDALAGVSAEVVSETVNGEIRYRIDISGTTSFVDSGNVLQTMGILEGTYGTVAAVNSGDAIYAMGGAAVTAATTFANIFTGALRGDTQNTKTTVAGGGYISATTQWNQINTGGDANDITGGETIRVEGVQHDGTAVDQTYTIADAGEQLSNFLSWLETQFGGSSNVDAYFDSTGRLILEDLQSGSSQLAISNVTYTGTALSFSSTEPFGNNISANDTISISGTRGDGTTVSIDNYTITDPSTNTIQNLLDKIHDGEAGDDAFGETTRTATPSVSGGKITITDDTTGDSQLSLTLIANNNGGGTLNFGEISMTTEGRSMQAAAGEDAQIVLDGVTIEKSSNTITDVIEGVTLNLAGEDTSTTVSLKVERDLSGIKSKIEDWVDSFNTIMNYINQQFSYDEDNERIGGILFGDGTLSSVKSELINTVTQSVTGASSDYNRLSLIGISLEIINTEEGEYNDLNLVIDDDDLTDALESNFNDVRKLFIAYGSCANSDFSYVGHTDYTVGGTYSVAISQAATRTTFTGGSALAGTLGENFTLTIEDYATDRQANVSLTTTMDIDDVVNAVNSELAEEETEVLTGSGATGKTVSTLFSSLTGANNGDVITFWGTKRNGVYVTGSYTVATTETVGDLLEAVEDMFDDEVTASLDGTGKIVITGKEAGDSKLTFGIDTATAGITDLDFGTVSTTNEGRYAITITASESSNQLVLTHNNYGTGYIIVVTDNSAGDPLGIGSGTQVYGVNVAGTINSLTATGEGQTLKLSSTGNNANGLEVQYTGSGTPTVNFTLILGIAELLDRKLGFITDETDGYVAYKQTSLENSIDSVEDQIDSLEDLLNQQLERMISRFVSMETALSRLQNQSAWLTSQFQASWSAWE